MALPFLRPSCVDFFSRKAHRFFVRKRCWEKSRKQSRGLSCSRPALSGRGPAHTRRQNAVATTASPPNSSRAFAQASLYRPRTLRKDIVVPPASSRARKERHSDLYRELDATVLRRGIQKSRPAFPVFDHETSRTSQS